MELELLINIKKYLYVLKNKFEENKPLFFQKKKLKNYYRLIETIENQIKNIDETILTYFETEKK